MREYKIYKTDLWFGIYKKREKGWFISVRFLDWKNKWTLRKEYARTFYSRDAALSVLTVMKHKDGKESD